MLTDDLGRTPRARLDFAHARHIGVALLIIASASLAGCFGNDPNLVVVVWNLSDEFLNGTAWLDFEPANGNATHHSTVFSAPPNQDTTLFVERLPKEGHLQIRFSADENHAEQSWPAWSEDFNFVAIKYKGGNLTLVSGFAD